MTRRGTGRGVVVALAVSVGVWLAVPAGAAAAVGQIGYDGCLADDASQGCGDLFAEPLTGAAGVAVSPDGNSAYVGSSFSGTITHFFVSKPGGQVTYDGCLGNDASQGCVDLPAAP